MQKFSVIPRNNALNLFYCRILTNIQSDIKHEISDRELFVI